jgi:phenylacetic acid degradation operon negative regulatory protein
MPAQRPQDLVFTLYGEYLLHRDEPIWVGSLISLLQPFGLSEGAVRTVLSRMARKGWLDGQRTGRNSFYDLAPKGRRLLEEGQDRIFHPSWDGPWDGSWFLLAYSIPEDVRHLRDRLRDRLAWLGFGSLGNGLWISPYDVEQEVRALAEQLGIQQHLECFQAQRVGNREPQALVDRCWDLPGVNAHYLA